ncbi:TIR domain-containing protein [Methylopila sp. M107]|uniref:TIR domain-containing protein n=1 Tax=Methylopila sp. M107 TaxID=1101190 RepID=UPI00036A2345|nr:TIR domain-containing protein [Methylopila sp. M107]
MAAMIDRFRGDDGRANLLHAMRAQAVVNGDAELALELADRVEIRAVQEGETIITQEGEDDDLYLIIAGSFGISVNGRRITSRGRDVHVGEMVLVEPGQPRAATVTAEEPSIVAKVSAKDFADLASRYPQMYLQIAKTLSRRLRERNKHVGVHRQKIKAFIISSVEALPVARIIQNAFEHDDVLTTVWTDGVFKATSYAVEALEAAVDDSDFAIAVAHADDMTAFRGVTWPVPRDNVVFELGLFMGRLGRARAILMEPRDEKVRLPSDLSGITTIPYRYEKGPNAIPLMQPACNRLREHVLDMGPYNG